MSSKNNLLTIAAFAVVLSVSTAQVSAKPDGKGPHKKDVPSERHHAHEPVNVVQDDAWLSVNVFADREREIIRQYYQQHPTGKKQKPLPPGLRKKVVRGGELPPGWQKKVARGEVLDDGVLYRANGLPIDLYQQLPRQPEGTVLVEVGGKIVRLLEATRTIVDVFDL